MSRLTGDYWICQEGEPYCDYIQSYAQNYKGDTSIEILLIQSTHQIYVCVRQSIKYFIVALELTERKIEISTDVIDMLTFVLQKSSEYLVDRPRFIRMFCVIVPFE